MYARAVIGDVEVVHVANNVVVISHFEHGLGFSNFVVQDQDDNLGGSSRFTLDQFLATPSLHYPTHSL